MIASINIVNTRIYHFIYNDTQLFRSGQGLNLIKQTQVRLVARAFSSQVSTYLVCSDRGPNREVVLLVPSPASRCYRTHRAHLCSVRSQTRMIDFVLAALSDRDVITKCLPSLIFTR